MDSIFLCGRSAYEYWNGIRTDGTPRLDEGTPVPRKSPWFGMDTTRLKTVSAAPPSDDLVYSFLDDELKGYALPLELLVARPSTRRVSNIKRCSVWGALLPSGSFVRVGSRLYVSTPEFLLLQMAATLPLIDLTVFAYELCGFYARSHWGFAASERCRPLTSVRTLSSYTSRVKDAPGIKRLRRSLRFVVDGSASPMETIVVLLLCLPRSLGGYGLPFPKMNGRVDVPMGLRDTLGGSYILCDAYWCAARFAVEYDGRLYHEGSDRVHRDYARSNSLRALGVGVETLTIVEVNDLVLFDAAARRVARALGVKLRGLDAAWKVRRQELRSQLLRV